MLQRLSNRAGLVLADGQQNAGLKVIECTGDFQEIEEVLPVAQGIAGGPRDNRVGKVNAQPVAQQVEAAARGGVRGHGA